MKIQTRRTEELIPYNRNPRNNDGAVEAVAASLKEFGFKQPIVIDKNGVIIAGHTRLKAAQKLGLETVPVVVADDLTEEQVKAYRLADNKTSELAGWDFDLLEAELEEITGIDMGAFGFEIKDNETPEDIVEDDFDEEEEEIPQRAKPGDIWVLGEHRLICGDATSEETMDKLLQGERPLFVFTDPPYGVSIGDKNAMLDTFQKSGRITENIKNDTKSEGELYELLKTAMETLRKKCSEACSYYVSAPQGGSLGRMMLEMMKDAGLEVRHNLVWVKSSATFSMGRLDYDYRHEPIFYTWTKKHNFYGGYSNTVIDDTKPLEKMNKTELKELVHALTEKKETSVIYCDKPMKCNLHPTMKPVKLIARFMINSSKKGDVVCDIFGGSGTTLIAAEQLNRKCRMVELDPHYCDVIIARWEAFTGKEAVLDV